MFKILDQPRQTATGLEKLPAWFLRVGAPIFCKPAACLFNLSMNNSTVPQQLKQACIRPIPKMSAPLKHADFRPLSITPVFTRVMERTVVKHFLGNRTIRRRGVSPQGVSPHGVLPTIHFAARHFADAALCSPTKR